jgi:ABC-2 type transport system ATP-binding protein
VLEVQDLSKRYGELVALDGCSFVAREGRITGFLGPNGAGKTTTMRAIFGLLLPDTGQISWRDRPIGRAERRRFGYMPEERGLYPKMRIRDQLVHFGFVAGLRREEAVRSADRWLERLGLAQRRDAAVDDLSHGNQQRVQLGVALVHDPELLILDEPFSGLDPLAVDDLGQLLQELAAEGRAVLFSSHQLDLVEDLCEDVVTIDHGRVVLAGTLEGLREAACQRRLTIQVAGAAPAWWQELSGVEGAAVDGAVDLLIDRDADLPAIVARAAAAGSIRRLEYGPPGLTDLFREAVQR